MATKAKRYYRGVWIADNTDIAKALDIKNAKGEPDPNYALAHKHFDAAMKDYHRNFPNPEFPDDPRRVSTTYRLPGL